jgi:hemerythrin-like domain-containing protein
MNDLKARLTQDHQEIDALLRSLSEDAAAPERSEPLHSTWCQFETRLLCHMDAEERYLLPLIEASDAEEAARTRLEHVRIRQMVYELGVAIELHSARQPAIDALVQLLHEHARREDLILYELAGERASSVIQRRIANMLRSALQQALHATVATPATTAPWTGAGQRARP